MGTERKRGPKWWLALFEHNRVRFELFWGTPLGVFPPPLRFALFYETNGNTHQFSGGRL